MEKLTATDFLLLEYIGKHEPVSKHDIEKALSHKIDSLDLRLQTLSTPESQRVDSIFVHISDSAYLNEEFEDEDIAYFTIPKHLGIYSLSPLGKRALQDYKVDRKSKRKLLWKENAWIPIVVSVATNLVLRLAEYLLPMILKWLSNAP